MKRIAGVLFLHMETGYEGPPWAIQDSNHIDMSKAVNGMGGWSYEGLNVLKDGDILTIYEGNNLVWSGAITIDADYNRIPWYILRGMSAAEQIKYFADDGKYHAVVERFDKHLTIYMYVSAQIFDLRSKGFDDDGPEITKLIDSLDDVWYKMTDEEQALINKWFAAEKIESVTQLAE